jgi:DNA polymerase III subunit alpha
MLDGAARLDETGGQGGAGRPAGDRHDRPRQHVRHARVLQGVQQAGIKPIIGTEAYMAHDHRSERPTRRGRIDDSGGDTEGGKKLYYHLTLLAENEVGYRNLIQLSSLAFLEGYYYKPRMDWELLEKYSDGLIATTGCLGGPRAAVAAQRRREGRARQGRPAAGDLREGQPVRRAAGPRPQAQRETNPKLIEIAKRSGARCSRRTTATTPTATTTKPTTRCCACRPGAQLSDPKRFKFEGRSTT